MSTGYSTISRNVLNGLNNTFECHYYAHNYVGQILPAGTKLKDNTVFNFTIHGNGREQYFKDILLQKLKLCKADLFCVLLDTFMLYPWILDYDFSPAQSIFYFPTDGGGGMPQACENILNHFNKKVAMSKFGQKQVKEVHGINTDYIPHAIDTDLYRPLSPEEKLKCRQELEVISINNTKVKGWLVNKFVVGVVSRNQGRKMLDRGLKAFSEFCKNKPDAVFLMHTDMTDAAAVFDMRLLINRLGLQNRIAFTDMKYYENFEYKDMNKLYNCFDVFFLSTSGEGFGIPTLEAMSCGIPCAVTDYTTTQELLIEDGVCGIPIKVCAELTGSWCVERAIMDLNHAVTCLNKLYKNEEFRKALGQVGREKALKLYSWDKVLVDWRNYLLDNGHFKSLAVGSENRGIV